jgi:hypothetical protein
MKAVEFEELKRRYPTFATLFHWVGPGGHIREGYYRRIPRTYYDVHARPRSQLESQLAFSKVARNLYAKNIKGFDENGVPLIASKIGEGLKGKKFTKPQWQRIMDELRESLKEVGEVVR